VRGILGKLWASPNTALGLAFGGVAVMLGARARVGRNAVEFLDHPFVAFAGKSAVTLGNTIHYAPGRDAAHVVARYDRAGQVGLGDHEEAHTRQYELWGPFFLPAYVVAEWLPRWDGRPRANPFEHAADDRAARAPASEVRSEPM
jgi:hypothetical protein